MYIITTSSLETQLPKIATATEEREGGRQTDRQTDRQTETEAERDRDREKCKRHRSEKCDSSRQSLMSSDLTGANMVISHAARVTD